MLKRVLGLILIIIFIGVSMWGSIFLANIENKSNIGNPNNGNLPNQCEDNCTNLPIMMIETNDEVIKKESKVTVQVSIIDYDAWNTTTMEPNLTTDATIKYRGNSSYATFDKSQYRIQFFKNVKKDTVQNYSLFGMSTNSDWVLYGPFLDRTLIRNRLMYSLSRELMDWAPDSRYFELYLDNEYQGVYLAVEPISNGDERIKLEPFGLLSGETPYIIRRDRVGTNINVLRTYGEINGHTSNELSILYPGNNSLTSKQYAWIERDVSKFEEVLYSSYFDNPTTGYAKYINVSSFVDYFILNEFAMITDSSELSTYLYKNLNGKLTYTVWDFNNGFNNYQWFDEPYDQFFNLDSNWFERLIQDRNFVDLIIERYQTLRENELSNTSIINRIDNEVDYLGLAIERNFEVWGYTFKQNLLSKDAQGQVRDPGSYEEAVEMLKNTIQLRLEYLDENLKNLYDFSIN
jgi:spore coat protein H